jgi:putative endonuclease
MNTRETGDGGEAAALKYLKRRGYRILEINKSFGFAEADIIAFKNNTLVFVEVKYRKTADFGRPEEAVNFRKRQRYIKMATLYSSRREFAECDVRFDIIAITDGQIEHFAGAFTA